MAPSVSTAPRLHFLLFVSICASPALITTILAIQSNSISVLTMVTPQLASKRASTRFSTYSQAPSIANTVKTSLTSESAQQEIKDIEEGLEKLEDKKLQSQRFVLSTERSDNLSKLALGAKLERALGRRMGGQDAVMRETKKSASEKSLSRDMEKTAVA